MNVRLVVTFALLSAGCEGAMYARTKVPPPAITAADGAKWAQYCTFNGATDLGEINRFLEDQGQRGWELVSVAGQTATIYCFKTRRP
jgi:hypothetical protein